MDEGADRGRALHGVGQPDVERDLGGFPGRPGEEEHRDERDEAGGEEARGGGGVDGGELRAPDVGQDEQDADDEGRVADPVDDEGFHARFRGRGPLEPEADQEVGTETDALPADEHQDDARGHDQDEHEEHEQVEEGEIPGIGLVPGHVGGGIDVDEEADAGDDEGHDRRELVEEERDRRGEGTAGDPGQQGFGQGRSLRPAAGETEECGEREDEGQENRAGGLGGDPFPGQLGPRSRNTRALAPGTSGMSQKSPAMLAPELLEIVGPDGLPLAEDQDDDGQPDHRFRRGDGDDEKDDGLAVRPAQGSGQGQERQIARVEHDLDGHELGQEVLLDEEGQDAQGEEQAARARNAAGGIMLPPSSRPGPAPRQERPG